MVAAKKDIVRTTPRRATTASAQSQSWLLQERTSFLIDALGGVTNLARLLQVTVRQPSRWRSGKERPGPEAARRLIDLDHVFARAFLLWEEPVARDWLQSPNAHLGGARPVDVLAFRGPSEVLDALDATQAGAFA